MARPIRQRFFEEYLPDILPPNLQWMRLYYTNGEKLLAYLTDHGAGKTAYRTALTCMTELRNHLLANETEFSLAAALAWFNNSSFKKKGVEITLHRLADLYEYGSIQPIHAFPHAISHYQALTDFWRSQVDKYLESTSYTENSAAQARRCIARFLFRMQEQGIQRPDQLSFPLLEQYCDGDAHISSRETATYTYEIGNIIRYMADQGLCQHALGWYPYFRMQGKVLRLSDLSDEQVERIESVKAESWNFPAEEFAALIPDFMDRFQQAGYSKTPCKVARYTLRNLLLFMGMHNLGYHPIIASVWLENNMVSKDSPEWKQSRRVLHLFEAYTVAGDIDPQLFFREKALLSDNLPEWCKSVQEAFLTQKVRERWEPSTISMYRSSVTRFCWFLCIHGIQSFSEIDADVISAFNREDIHLTAEGKNAYNVRIRKFLQYLERRGLVTAGLHQSLFCTAAPSEKIVVTLKEAEKEEIQQFRANCDTSKKLRENAIVQLGLKMGLRASDIVSIKLQDIDWESQTIQIVQKKTAHEVRLPMPTAVGNAIYLYITKGRPTTVAQTQFVRHRTPFCPLNRHACIRALKTILPERNVPRSGFHVTRKTFATDKLRNGSGKQTISELLGHRDTSTLARYIKLDSERMKACPLTLEETNLCLGGNRYEV